MKEKNIKITKKIYIYIFFLTDNQYIICHLQLLKWWQLLANDYII